MGETDESKRASRTRAGVEHKLFEFTVKGSPQAQRLDAHLAAHFPDYSRTFIKRLMEQGAITVNGCAVKPSYTPRAGDEIVARVPVPAAESVEAEDIPLDIIYEDDWIVVVNKPPDMVVHPAKGHQSGTLVNAIAYHCRKLSRFGGELRAGVVHRLDRDTSGVILMVKDEAVHEAIARQFERRQVKKQYVAICERCPELDSDVIDAPIGPHPRLKQKMAVRYDVGRKARTVYEVAERLGDFSVLRCFPETGRTHQIRVHLQHIGHPIVCDMLYGRRDALYLSGLTGQEHPPSEEPLLARQALHARRLTIHHPALERTVCFEAELPADMRGLIEALREHGD